MVKNARLTLRMDRDLRIGIEEIAAREGRSVTQVCDALLKAGVEAYSKQGGKFLQKYTARNPPKISQ